MEFGMADNLKSARDETYECLEVALRVFATREVEDSPTDRVGHRRRTRRRTPERTLVLDTETTVDASQALKFGVWRYYVDRADALPGPWCVEEGVFYADDLPETDPEGFAILRAYVESHTADTGSGRSPRIRFLSRSEFVEQILWRYGFKLRATVVGFNLPFDLSRIAIAASAARKRFAGGISLLLYDRERYRPRIAYKTIDSKRTLIGFTTPDGVDETFRGHFLDLRTLTFALTDRSYSLESACNAFGVPYVKRELVHGTITADYVTYCREDVAATSQLFSAAMAEYRRHPIELQATKAFSPASIGKSYLRAMGIKPILERQPDFDPKVLGWGMSAFYGGRAECRIRKVPLPVVYVDFLSMYPTVNALMGVWDLIVALKITTVDATAKVRRLLTRPDLYDACFSRSTWRDLVCLVEIVADGDILPVRAAYDPAGVDYGIGVNPYRNNHGCWYTLADVIASVLLTGKVPVVRRAIALRASKARQGGLRPVSIRGMVEVDPRDGDFFVKVIELRKQIESDPAYSRDEKERLSRFLKILANATSYGILVEMTRRELHEPVKVTVYAGHDEPFVTKTLTPEDPGPFCFPPIAACITGGARLMLALLERAGLDPGGSYVFCDTDSMGIVSDRLGCFHACPQ